MTRRQGHLVELTDVPGVYDDAARVRLATDQVERALDLIDVPAVRRAPGPPLRAVDRAELAVVVGPFVPDRDVVVAQILDVRVAFEEPQKLVNDRAQMKLLRREHGEARDEVEAHLIAE